MGGVKAIEKPCLGIPELSANPKRAVTLMKVMRLLEEQGQTFTLPDGKSVKAYVGEVLPGGFAGFAKEKEKAEKAEAERYKVAKAQAVKRDN